MKKGKNKKKRKRVKCPFFIMLTGSVVIAMVGSKELGISSIYEDLMELTEQRMEKEGEDKAINPEEPPEIKIDLAAKKSEEHTEENKKKTIEEALDICPTNVEEAGKSNKNDMENAGNLQDGEKTELNQDIINNTCNNTGDDNETSKIQDSENARQEENRVGITEYEYYTPIETDSRYYTDAGKTAMTTEYPYESVDGSYFDDAAFIGDSRTVGISDYAGIDNADFYCESSMTIFKVLEDKGVTYQKTGKKVDLKKVLAEKKYGKIYLMLGINELGYGNTQMYFEKYKSTLESIRGWQPDAIVYIMANLHISEEKNNMDTEFNNVNINDKNAAIASLADGETVFYLDCNPVFTDENGFLKADLTFDGVHLYAQHYDVWREFLMEHAVVKDEEDGTESGAGNKN